MQNKQFKRYGVTLKPLTQDMLEQVREWRNSPEIAQHMLDQRLISAEQQQAWFQGLNGDSSRFYWVVWFKEEAIGVVSLLNINQQTKTAEPGMYIVPERYRNNIVPFCVAFALNDYAFEELGLEQLLGKIFADNDASLRFHETSGYVQTGQRQFVPLQENTASTKNIPGVKNTAATTKLLLDSVLTKDAYYAARTPIARFIRYD